METYELREPAGDVPAPTTTLPRRNTVQSFAAEDPGREPLTRGIDELPGRRGCTRISRGSAHADRAEGGEIDRLLATLALRPDAQGSGTRRAQDVGMARHGTAYDHGEQGGNDAPHGTTSAWKGATVPRLPRSSVVATPASTVP